MKLSLYRAKQSPGEVNARFTQIEAMVDEIMATVRSISQILRPGMLEDMGLLETLNWHFQNYTERTGIVVNFRHADLDGRIPPPVAAYRIAQEALTNVALYMRRWSGWRYPPGGMTICCI